MDIKVYYKKIGMRREILAILLFSVVVNAAFDQSYVHTISRDGSSTIQKTMDMAIFSGQLGEGAFEKIDETCRTRPEVECAVKNKTLTIIERFSPGEYYSVSTEEGMPFITIEVEIKKIPTDRFSSSLETILIMANLTTQESGDSVNPLILKDEQNKENAYFLKKLNANITYEVNMPSSVVAASAGTIEGNVSGKTVMFDLVEVLEESENIKIKGEELNFGYILLIAMVIVLAALAISFFKIKKRRKK